MATERLRQIASAAAAAAVNLTRPNYFDTSKRGEVYELRNELNSEVQLVRKEAVKKVIANMTTGKDVGSLFPDVLKNIQTDDIELKKLVYLYLMNHAKSQPELVVLAINTFCKDALDPNPLIRALAIRTMGCLRVEKVLDYLCEPLMKALNDDSPYVRKTAALCAAKVAELSPELADETGIIETLKGMLSDNNASVVANVVAALSDIQQANPQLEAFIIDSRTAEKLLLILNDCTEWGQITILDRLAYYTPSSEMEAFKYLEKVLPRLQHANSGVVLSAIKVILVLMNSIPTATDDFIDNLKRKLAPPLVSMMSSPPEVQYVTLRNIKLILQRWPDILSHGVRVFFCKFSDPLYVKLEKLEIITLLIDEKNFDQIISELTEYSKDVDVEFAKKSIISIAKCGIKIRSSSEKAFNAIRQLVKSQVDFIFQSVAIALSILYRQYPHDHNDLFPELLKNLEIYDDDDSRAAIVWILGQYGGGSDLPNTMELLEVFSENFPLEPTIVQSELLIAGLKLFFKDTTMYGPFLKNLINKGLSLTENADLRERCIMYGRLLEVDQEVIDAIKYENLELLPPGIESLDEKLFMDLIPEIGLLASIIHRLRIPKMESISSENFSKPPPLPDLLDLEDNTDSPTQSSTSVSPKSVETSKPPIIDLLAD